MEFRFDNDNDGYSPDVPAAPEDIAYACENPEQFVLPSATPDCDDGNPAIYPGAFDVPDNGIDEDCDGYDATVHVGCPIDVVKAYNTVLPWEPALQEDDRNDSCTLLYHGGDSRVGFYTDSFEITAFDYIDGAATKGLVRYTEVDERGCRGCQDGLQQDIFEIQVSPEQARSCARFVGCEFF